MSVWLIEPLDPLIARDGRPAAVNHFLSVAFPYPSMLAGVVRTRLGSEGGAFKLFDHLKDLKEKVWIRGPLLAELKEEDAIQQWLAPAPRDAVLLEKEKTVTLRRLAPRPLRDGEGMDSLGDNHLVPLGYQDADSYGKPPKDSPAFWSWQTFETWLKTPEDQEGVNLKTLGIESLPKETRVHLAIQPGERVGLDGMLFQTSGLRFLYEKETTSEDGKPRKIPFPPRRFALSLQSEEAVIAGKNRALQPQIAPMGGERRLARWFPAECDWPRMPPEIVETITETGRARLILLTPAIFETGAIPGWNKAAWPLGGDVKAAVKAAAVPRPEIVSGWDLEKGKPKKTRRLAPAGSVYFLELTGDRATRRAWCESAWLHCISDDEQDRRDGFGLAVLGTWEKTR